MRSRSTREPEARSSSWCRRPAPAAQRKNENGREAEKHKIANEHDPHGPFEQPERAKPVGEVREREEKGSPEETACPHAQTTGDECHDGHEPDAILRREPLVERHHRRDSCR